MKIFKKEMRFYFQPRTMEFVKCPNCGSQKLREIGDVLECMDCGGVKALS